MSTTADERASGNSISSATQIQFILLFWIFFDIKLSARLLKHVGDGCCFSSQLLLMLLLLLSKAL